MSRSPIETAQAERRVAKSQVGKETDGKWKKTEEMRK